jgi:glycerol-3-phosphate dehydrogenase
MAPNVLHNIGWWDVVYYWTGAKMYDLIADWMRPRLTGPNGGFMPSRHLTRTQATEAFPMLRQAGLRGAIVYYDGLSNFHDAHDYAMHGGGV